MIGRVAGSVRVPLGRRAFAAGSSSTPAWLAKADACDITQSHKTYKGKGWVHLPWAFLDGPACEELASFALRSKEERTAFHSRETHTVYQEEPDPSLPDNHCRNAQQKSEKHIVDYERIGAASPLRALYQEPRFVELVQRVVGLDRIYASACPFNSAYLNVFEDGHGLGWHFDRSEFGVNLILRSPSAGGAFEFHRGTRSEEDLLSYDRASEVLALGSAHPGVSSITDARPGDLVIFNGRLSMHRVTAVEGLEPRVNAIFTYEKEPGARPNAYSLQKFFGRTVEEQEASMASR